MASVCVDCGQGLSILQRARGHERCDACTEKARVALHQAVDQLDPAISAVINAGTATGPAVDHLRVLEVAIRAGGGDTINRKGDWYRQHIERALADDALTADEEGQLDAVGDALYPPSEEQDQVAAMAPYLAQIFIAMVNDGRLPTMHDSKLMLKRGEIAHLETSAALLKEVVQREFQGGSRGMSFRVMKGVSYRVGSFRGHMVEIGRSLVEVDQGTLCVTSQRTVYLGARKTIEVPYAKMIEMNVYTDGIQFHVSGRQTPSMFRVANGSLVAAAINAASQKLL